MVCDCDNCKIVAKVREASIAALADCESVSQAGALYDVWISTVRHWPCLWEMRFDLAYKRDFRYLIRIGGRELLDSGIPDDDYTHGAVGHGVSQRSAFEDALRKLSSVYGTTTINELEDRIVREHELSHVPNDDGQVYLSLSYAIEE